MLLSAAVMLIAASQSLRAQQMLPWRSTEWSESFAPPFAAPYFLGSATRIDSALGWAVLTPEEPERAGRLFLPSPRHVETFDASFRAWFGHSDAANLSGADGIVFVFAPRFDYPESGGGTLNFDGCLGYGVECDTYMNDDLDDRSQEHVAVIRDRSGNHLISELLAVPTVEDARWHPLRIRFRSGDIEVYIDGTRRLDTVITDFTPFEGYFGFASATGFAFNEQRVDDIVLSMPARGSMDFGTRNVCLPVRFDTAVVIRNNHPDGGTLRIDAITLASMTPGVFSIPLDPAPASVPFDGELRIPIRVDLAAGGDYSAVLKIEGANGETVFDTLRISAVAFALEWTAARVEFPITRVGSTASTIVLLRNSGPVPMRIDGSRWARGDRGIFTAELGAPVTLAPGDTLPVVIRFLPDAEGMESDSLFILTACGEHARIDASGNGGVPSCRHPDGLHRAAVPGVSVSPQPARDMLNVEIDAPAAIAATLRLYDARGREVGMLYEGTVEESGIRVAYPLAGLANGLYYLLLRCSLGERMLPVIVEK